MGDIGNYFKQENTNREITNLFNNLLKAYKNLQNNTAKHNSGIFNEAEVEFLFYLAGSFMRLLIQTKKSKIGN